MEQSIAAIIAMIMLRAFLTGALSSLLYETGMDLYSCKTTECPLYGTRFVRKVFLIGVFFPLAAIFHIHWPIFFVTITGTGLFDFFLVFGRPRLAAYKQRRLEQRRAKDQLTDLRSRKRILLESQQKLRIEEERVGHELVAVDEQLRREPGGPYRA